MAALSCVRPALGRVVRRGLVMWEMVCSAAPPPPESVRAKLLVLIPASGYLFWYMLNPRCVGDRLCAPPAAGIRLKTTSPKS